MSVSDFRADLCVGQKPRRDGVSMTSKDSGFATGLIIVSIQTRGVKQRWYANANTRASAKSADRSRRCTSESQNYERGVGSAGRSNAFDFGLIQPGS